MTIRSEQIIFGTGDREQRFDGKAVRRILERAAARQVRLDNTSSDSYTLDELEEMAAEAGISRAALASAIEDRPSRWSPLWRWLPASWSPLTRQLVFWTGTGIVLLGIMLAFPFVAEVLFWATIIVLVMMALGISPF